MNISHWLRALGVLALFVCAGCPSTEDYVIGPRPPHGFTYVMMDVMRARRLGLEPVADESADESDAEDRTGIVITGGAQFGTYTGGAIPVTLTTIKVNAMGETGYAMQGIKVYAGSGFLPGAPTAGTLVADLPHAGQTLNATLVTITSFDSPAPGYDPDDQAYWIWVVVDGLKAGVSKPVNGSLQIELIEDSFGAGFYEY